MTATDASGFVKEMIAVCSSEDSDGSTGPLSPVGTRMLLLAIVFFALMSVPQQETETDDIVVVARSTKCLLKFADRELDKAEFKRRTAQWAAGRPVRVIARQSADRKCLAKIAFQLADRGVRRITFVEPSDATAPNSVGPWVSGDDPFAVDPRAAKRPIVADGDRRTP
ncbi:hypothetical protein [Sphingomonas hylomeconis]|uniref:Biopolymer transporter ExbD n=1 Tax=Sphingomonas hylomeconis TaxID=1395958 RepID=A0ABV7SSG8_9SPHN|nr:hypothetical protein [Sphingomonas hylomeconis]